MDTDQSLILQKWHHTLSINIPNSTEVDIIYNLNGKKRDRLCNAYIAKKIHNPPPLYTNKTFLPYTEDTIGFFNMSNN